MDRRHYKNASNKNKQRKRFHKIRSVIRGFFHETTNVYRTQIRCILINANTSDRKIKNIIRF